MSFLKIYIKKYLKLFLVAVSCLTLETLCDLLQPTVMSRIIDIGVAGKNSAYVIRMGGLMLLITAAGACAAVARNIISSNVSLKFGAELRSDLFKKIQSFSFESIDRFETASLVTRLTNDVTQVQNFINGLMRIFVKAPLLCIGSIIMAVLLNPRMSLLLLAVVPIIGILIFASTRIGFPYFTKVQKALDRVNGVVREYLSGVRVVKAFNRFTYEEERFSIANSDLSALSAAAMRVMAIFTPAITLTVNIGIISVLWLGGIRVNNGNMRIGQIIAFINYMTQILQSLMMLSFVFNMFVRAKASSERISEVFSVRDHMQVAEAGAGKAAAGAGASSSGAYTGTVSNSSGIAAETSANSAEAIKYGFPVLGHSSKDVNSEPGSVEFLNVGFSYYGSSGDPVLKNISFKCSAGETTGIIGSTGSGKSSLVNLIPRFYDVTSGTLKVNGASVNDTDPELIRRSIAIVPQKTILFTGTILDNIKWGNKHAGMAEIEYAAAAAQAHDFIASFPEGYETLLGQGGVNLSGGQKQRISIARALVRKPDILILDDCTSAVDLVTEARIKNSLRKYYSGLTCFIVAQRISSVIGADRIIVLDNGEAVGIGTHKELIQTCAVYRDIFRSQIGREDEKDGTDERSA